MAEPSRQLVLDLPHEPRFDREAFLIGPSNERALRLVDSWPDWSDTNLHLSGPPGSGKSHLAAAWAAKAGAVTVEARAIEPRLVGDLGRAQAVVIEDLDRGSLDEAALFHLLNRSRERGTFVLFTASHPLEPELIRTPDLLSRLRLAPAMALGHPDDALLRAVFMKLFADRQLSVEANVVEFLLVRIERSLVRAAEIVRDLDREALSRGRRITRATASDVLGLDLPADDADGSSS